MLQGEISDEVRKPKCAPIPVQPTLCAVVNPVPVLYVQGRGAVPQDCCTYCRFVRACTRVPAVAGVIVSAVSFRHDRRSDDSERSGYIPMHEMEALFHKDMQDFDHLRRDKWVQVSDDGKRVYLGPRAVAELDVATRNSLPSCTFCHEIVVSVRVCAWARFGIRS